jgi:gliding motility-associated protein GldC
MSIKNKLMKKEIKFTLDLDENFIPTSIEWTASEAASLEVENVKAIMISVWDPKENVAKRVDLWTKDMYVEEMKAMYFQTLMTMADGFERATGETEMSKEMRAFSENFGRKMDVLKD